MIEDVLPSQIIWIDPGRTTGYAFFTNSASFHSGQLEFQSFGEQLEMTCEVNGSSVWIGWEDFIINRMTASKKGSECALETIGVCRYLAQKYDCTILEPATPSSRELGSLLKLKRLGWHKPGQVHANDAAQHLLAFMIRDHALPEDLLKKIMQTDSTQSPLMRHNNAHASIQ